MFSPPAGCKDLYKHTKILPIPRAIDNYNYYIGSVDCNKCLRTGLQDLEHAYRITESLDSK